MNEKIEQLRLEAASALIEREDVIVVASVSCIYGFGSPENFKNRTFKITKGQKLNREGLDIPEIGLVAIMDADKEGFLRNEN